MTVILEAEKLSAGYMGRSVIHEVDLRVEAGEVVCLLGSNGVGKTTTLLALSGELRPMEGNVSFASLGAKAPLHRRARRGLSYVTEERSVFKGMSARENLRCAGVSVKEVTALFPELDKCIDTKGGLLSGGEQQMLTLGRALARHPSLLLADELSLGLAPLVVDRLLAAVRTAAKESGAGVLIVEQHVRKALTFADRVYLMRRGRIELALTADEARTRIDEIERSYLSSAVMAEE